MIFTQNIDIISKALSHSPNKSLLFKSILIDELAPSWGGLCLNQGFRHVAISRLMLNDSSQRRCHQDLVRGGRLKGRESSSAKGFKMRVHGHVSLRNFTAVGGWELPSNTVVNVGE